MKETEQAIRKEKISWSPVWLIPLIALLIAAWLGFRAWEASGAMVTIEFPEASGIREGKTEVRYKDVRVGLVKDIQLKDDLQKVLVQVEIAPDMSDHLSGNSRFWVVEPRVTLSGVSGLNTLVSGVYIAMDPGAPGKAKRHYVGLESAPSIGSSDEGTSFRLNAAGLKSLNIGAPVYYRQVKVGEVTSYRLDASNDRVEVRIFVTAPYDKLVKTSSQFWNVSGLGVELDAQGFRASMPSLASLVAGGVAFHTVGQQSAEPASADQLFKLYDSEREMRLGQYDVAYEYRLDFSGSVRGLRTEAPVEIRGIKVGEVTTIDYDPEREDIYVWVSLYPQMLQQGELLSKTELNEILKAEIAEGLRAQLKTANLLTGSLYVDLVKLPDTEGRWQEAQGAVILPTASGEYEVLTRQLSSLMSKLEDFPLAKIGDNAALSLEHLSSLLGDLQQRQVVAKVDDTLVSLGDGAKELQPVLEAAHQSLGYLDQALLNLNSTLAPDSVLQFKLIELMEQIDRTAGSVGNLADELRRNPSSIWRDREAK